MKKKISLITTLVVGLTILLFVAMQRSYYISPSVALNEQQRNILTALGDSALRYLDVPVASILLYNDTIIGTGYNTVLANGDAGGHAEINAISSALRAIGKEKFDLLNREKLTLITTFEPCLMYRGAIIEYRIRTVIFLKPKSLFHWLIKHAQGLRYELTKKHGEPESLQDSLFIKHPKYLH